MVRESPDECFQDAVSEDLSPQDEGHGLGEHPELEPERLLRDNNGQIAGMAAPRGPREYTQGAVSGSGNGGRSKKSVTLPNSWHNSDRRSGLMRKFALQY
jgi:hypothetical protein